ncbi:MAG: hypothetical protein Q3998_02485 [Porphyromonas sp.]|nr:hypothetical protein [Porphyromonas sp.]
MWVLLISVEHGSYFGATLRVMQNLYSMDCPKIGCYRRRMVFQQGRSEARIPKFIFHIGYFEKRNGLLHSKEYGMGKTVICFDAEG